MSLVVSRSRSLLLLRPLSITRDAQKIFGDEIILFLFALARSTAILSLPNIFPAVEVVVVSGRD
jgi:hypothetical protein